MDVSADQIEQLWVADISIADRAAIASLKMDGDVLWWLELGDELLLVTKAGMRRASLPQAIAIRDAGTSTHSQLRLRARGCNEPDSTPGRFIARGGRWEVLELAKGETTPARRVDDHGHGGEWREVIPNTVIAYRYLPAEKGTNAPNPIITAVVNSVDPMRWMANLTTLSGWNRSSYGTGLAQSRAWIETQFSALGLAVSAPSFSMPGSGGGQISVNNVLGRWTGTRFPNEWIIVGAHYDSRNQSSSSTAPTPGAEDNASGCAGVIELARVLSAFRPERSILYMCYAGEEQGLLGSRAHVTALQNAGELSLVQAVVTMDMIAYSADATLDVLFESNATWSSYLNRFAAAAATYVPQLNVTLSTNPFGSDHVPYLNAGRQSLLLIENDWDIYPHYHRSTDTVANLGPHASAMGGAILKTSAAVLADLSGANLGVYADGFETISQP